MRYSGKILQSGAGHKRIAYRIPMAKNTHTEYIIVIAFPLMWHVWVRRGGCIGSWWGNRRERDHWGGQGVDVWIILGWISRRWDVGIWTGLGWPRIEAGGGRL